MNSEIAKDLLYLKQTKFTNTKMIDDLLNVDSNVIGYLLIDYFEISMINSIINLINSIIIGQNCLISEDVVFRNTDSHPIFSIDGDVLNTPTKGIKVENKVRRNLSSTKCDL